MTVKILRFSIIQKHKTAVKKTVSQWCNNYLTSQWWKHLYWPSHSSRQSAFFQPKQVLIFFLFLHENICCGYSLEVPQWGTSNEYPQHIFSWRNKKNIYQIPFLIQSCGASLSVPQIDISGKKILQVTLQSICYNIYGQLLLLSTSYN